jgi:hypothetical protein
MKQQREITTLPWVPLDRFLRSSQDYWENEGTTTTATTKAQ